MSVKYFSGEIGLIYRKVWSYKLNFIFYRFDITDE